MTEVHNVFSQFQDFTLNNNDGSAVAPVNLKGTYKTLVVRCEDLTNIGTASNFDVYTSPDESSTLVKVNKTGGAFSIPSVPFEIEIDLVAVKRVRLITNNPVGVGDVVFKFMGIDRMVQAE